MFKTLNITTIDNYNIEQIFKLNIIIKNDK